MEKSKDELVQMVYQVLLESKNPLMAKKIAYNIYKKFDGYRMSRFAVRDILRKDMKGQFEYNNINYTYSINSYEQIQRKQQKSEEVPLEIIKKNTKDVFKNRDEYNLLKEHLTNPYHYFLLQLDLTQAKNIIHFNNDKFQKMFEESSRDNEITYSEEQYLFEKAKHFGISTQDLSNAIETIDFKAYKSFKLLVDEICEDGIITETELRYIKEKALVYNVPENQLQRMMKSGLFKVKFIDKYKGNRVFYDYVKSILLLRAFSLDFDNDIYSIANDHSKDFINKLKEDTRANVIEIKAKINETHNINANIDNLNDIFKLLDVNPLDIKGAISIKNNTHFEINNTEEDLIKINGYKYKIKWINVKNRPLFFEEYIDSTYIITLNENHWFFQHKNTSEKKLLEKVVLSLICTKSDFYGSELDSFFNKLQGNIDLLKFEYN